MDTMKSLNKSLPAAYSGRAVPPEQLLQAFRTAALSVTNLYKASVTEQSNSRLAGYQDALEDLLDFLDGENLGLQDGEGWRVRQWATERFDGTANHQKSTEIEEDRMEPDRVSGEASSSRDKDEDSSLHPDQARVESNNEQIFRTTEPTPVFEFTAGRNVPSSDSAYGGDQAATQSEHTSISSFSTKSPIRLEILNRSMRVPQKQANIRHNTRSSNRDSHFTSGTKRKLQFPDFFDISNDNVRESGSGTKKGRII